MSDEISPTQAAHIVDPAGNGSPPAAASVPAASVAPAPAAADNDSEEEQPPGLYTPSYIVSDEEWESDSDLLARIPPIATNYAGVIFPHELTNRSLPIWHPNSTATEAPEDFPTEEYAIINLVSAYDVQDHYADILKPFFAMSKRLARQAFGPHFARGMRRLRGFVLPPTPMQATDDVLRGVEVYACPSTTSYQLDWFVSWLNCEWVDTVRREHRRLGVQVARRFPDYEMDMSDLVCVYHLAVSLCEGDEVDLASSQMLHALTNMVIGKAADLAELWPQLAGDKLVSEVGGVVTGVIVLGEGAKLLESLLASLLATADGPNPSLAREIAETCMPALSPALRAYLRDSFLPCIGVEAERLP